MDNASQIGRVGVLAVALGIGMALASSPGLAVADTTDAGAASSNGSAPSARSGATRASAADSPSRTRRQPQAGARPAVSTAARSSSPAAAVSRPGRQARVVGTPSAPVGVSVPGPTPSIAAVAATSSASSSPATPLAAVVSTLSPVDVIVHAVSASVAQFINSVLSPLAGNGGPLSPTGSPLLWTALAWARRELGDIPSASSTTAVAMSTNLLINPGGESGDPSLTGNASVTIPGWTVTGTPTVIQYGTPRNMWPVGLSFATPDLPAFMGFPTTSSGPGDTQFFGGGNVATSSLTQTVGLTGPSAPGVTYDLSADLGGWLINPGAASIKVDFLDANRVYLASSSIGPVTLFDRFFQTTLLNRSVTGTLPTGTQYAQVTVNLQAWNPIFPGLNADYNSAFADNVSLTVSDLSLAPAPQALTPPASTVGQLDHVFMTYMENKGYYDIVGSPNAPFLNSLINNFGFADNYYALTHGSLPNYYPIVGGTDFNITYNCAAVCIDDAGVSTLFGNIDAAGKTWRSYAQSLQPGASPLVSSGDYAFNQTPFPAFTSIYNNPTYAAAHIVPLEQMAIDLQSTATAPDYAWFQANEDFAGEGPTNTLEGALKFVLTQISPSNQYNVPALDQFLSEYVPVITNSAVWQDPTQKSVVVITFDEDNNNLSLGFGNQGNHIVTVVIPSPGAIASGMRSGSFIDSTHYDHYSLLRTIEESLGLPSMTNNDKYAVPMNGFWGTGTGSVV